MSLPQGLTASKSVGRLRTFGVANLKGVPLMNVSEYVKGVSLLTAESPKKNCQP